LKLDELPTTDLPPSETITKAMLMHSGIIGSAHWMVATSLLREFRAKILAASIAVSNGTLSVSSLIPATRVNNNNVAASGIDSIFFDYFGVYGIYRCRQ
jgi:hypothetical protein